MAANKKKSSKTKPKVKDLKAKRNPKGGTGVSPRGRTPGKINLN